MIGDMVPLRPAGFVDPGWEHGTAQDEKKKKVKCNYCGKVVSGGIYRLKQHLARISGEVTYCDRAPEDVCLKMKENLDRCRSNKKRKLSEIDERPYLSFQSHDGQDSDRVGTFGYARKGKKVVSEKSLVLNTTSPRALGYVDPGWEHGVAQDARKKKVKCNYCGKIVSGGINRFKQHLARIPGEVAPCKSAPHDVYLKIKENMKWHRTGRRHAISDVKETPSFYVHSDTELEEDESEEDTSHRFGRERVVIRDKRLSKDFRRGFSAISSGNYSDLYLKKPRPNFNALKSQGNNSSNKRSRKEVLSAICEFFSFTGVPLHAANSLSFQKMLELVGHHGPSVSGSLGRQISGRFLHDEICTVRNYLAEYRTCWSVTGCSVMADSWRNSQGKTIINFLVSCPRGVYFISSVDATDIVDDPSSLFNLLDKIVEEIGEENVVQVVTQSTPSYKAAGKMLEEKRKRLFWTPCVVYCIDRVLEDFTKIKSISECIEKAQKLTKLIYNRAWLLNFMKKEYTAGQDLLRPSFTKYASFFYSLQGVIDHKFDLKRMFQSHKWLSCRLSKSDEGKEVGKIVLNAAFWKKMQRIWKLVDPILHVLDKVHRDGNLSMPSIYNDLCKAKLAIKSIHGDDVCKYGPFIDVIDSHLSFLFYHRLCIAAYNLNPAYRYRPDYMANPEVVRGLNDCIVRLEPEKYKSASMQMSDFLLAKADFGTELAISTRTELEPAVWWQQHGINCLELQRIAVHILSQTCSSFGCEHNWSLYDQIHCQRQNRLAQKKINELLYIHYNLRLRERQVKQTIELMSLDSALLEGLLDDWIGDTEKQTAPYDEGILYHEDGYDDDMSDYDDGSSDMRRGSLDMVTLAEVDPLEVHPYPGPFMDDDDDEDLDFLDDDLSD